MFDISIELSSKKLLEKSRSFLFWGQLMLASSESLSRLRKRLSEKIKDL